MKVALLNGSPKGKKSNSVAILNGLKNYLINEENLIECEEFMWSSSESGINDFEELLKCDAIVFAFPLYVDSIPSHFLRCLERFENYIKTNNIKLAKEIKAYVIVNNGFFQGKQNYLAIENIEHFCKHVGFEFMQGIGIGGGEMLLSVENIPFGRGPKKSIGNELMIMAENIKLREGSISKFIEPNIPPVVYKVLAEKGWRRLAKKNGLTAKDLGRQLIY